MSRGLYTAASAMVAGMERQLVLANMVANVNTPGFKGEQTIMRSFSSVFARTANGGAVARLGTGTAMERVGVDLRAGVQTITGSRLDVALEGEGFIVVEDAEGNLRLTRDGHLRVDAEGFLTTTDGMRVQSENATAIAVGAGEVIIQRDGTVLVDGEVAGKIRLALAPADQLLRAGSGSFVVEDAATLEAATAQLIQGSLERSNVNTTQVLTDMVGVARAYESAQRIFAMQNQIQGRAASDIARL